MVIYYGDTSALLKRYVDELGSAWVRATIAPAADVLVISSQLALIEIVSALNRRVREGAITAREYPRVVGMFHTDCHHEYRFFALDSEVVDLACTLLERYPLRAYDATHLATAVIAQQMLRRAGDVEYIFLSADDRLNTAAAAEGLAVDNPNVHD